MEEGSKTEPGIGTHSPFGIAVVDIAHEGMGLDFSVDFDGDRGKGNFKAFKVCESHPTDASSTSLPSVGLGKISGGIADTDFLVSPFHLRREALFEGVAEGRCKTASSFKIDPLAAGS